MRVTYRPLGSDWPGERTPWAARQRSPFTRASKWGESGMVRAGGPVPWPDTLLLLDRELAALGVTEVVFQLDLREQDIRLDGMPRSDARPADPAVIISFESRFGPLRYQCDRFERWQDNVRAISLGLEALRKVERYGITKRGEQYAGWRSLPEKGAGVEAAKETLFRLSGMRMADFLVGYREAAKRHHPDAGGRREDWDELQRAKEALGL